MLPNAARYQLRYTPIVIKLWSCKWSNLWSNTFLTAFFHFPNRPKYARLKGFRRLSLSYSKNTAYAPKPRALPTALHPENVTRLACRKPPVCGCRQAFRIFLFVLYHVCFQKSRFFGFFFSFGEAGIYLPKSTSIVFCVCPKGREKHEKQMVEKGVGGTSCSVDSRVRCAGACKGNSSRIR